MQKSNKNNFKIQKKKKKKKTYAYFQAIPKAPVKFQKDQSKTVGGVIRIRWILPVYFCGISALKMSKFKMQKKEQK